GGRPEIEERLRRLIATALGTKVTFARLRLDPLNLDLVADFIRHRLRQAGAEDEAPFSPETMDRIAANSLGNPRAILELCANELGGRGDDALPSGGEIAPPVAKRW